MTNYRKAITGASRPYNQKDGVVARPRSQARIYEALGFAQTDWNKWSYTWEGNFPIFALAPGILSDKAGLIATFSPEIRIHFPYSTDPADIKARLDDEILAIMRHDAEIDTPLELEWIEF